MHVQDELDQVNKYMCGETKCISCLLLPKYLLPLGNDVV